MGKTYGQILKSSALIGGSSVVNVCFGICPDQSNGFDSGADGLWTDGPLWIDPQLTSQPVAGLGMNTSGVRQIAEAVGQPETPNALLAR
jgi:antigen flippase